VSVATLQQAQVTPEGDGLIDHLRRISWRKLDELLNRATNALLREELGGTRRIAVFAPNCAETVIAYLGAILAGVSSVPVNFHLTSSEVAFLLADSGASLLMVGPETAEVGLQAAKAAGIERIIVWRYEHPGMTGWSQWLECASSLSPPSDMAPRPYLHYTSGTTGRPKGTESPPNMFAREASVAKLFDGFRQFAELMPQGPTLVVGPLYHTGPLSSLRSIANGNALVIMPRFDAQTMLATIAHHSIASVVMVPTHFQRLLALPAAVRAKYDVSSLKFVAHTGAGCPDKVKRQMIDWFGPVLVEGYGGTECGTTNVILSQEWLTHPGSVGKTLEPFEVRVVDDEGQLQPAGVTGLLYFLDKTGRGVVYHNNHEGTVAAHLAPGVFTLGDIGYVDSEGYVYITDRASDMIVSGGVNIYPAEVEGVLLRHSLIADAAVIGVPDTDMGEAVKALIVPADRSALPTEEELDRLCRQHIAGYKCPRSYCFVDDIGRNAMGKLNKRALRAPYWPSARTIAG
jgi:long-chain acyl-CoA synthetase